jgi:1,3-propanediol dehydrogenase
MARPIGACFHVPHGISNAVLLPTVMRFTVPGNVEKFARIAEAMGEQVADLSIHEAAENAVNAVERLCGDFGMSGLRSAGVSETELKRLAPKMARDAIASGSPGNNPRIATEEEIIQLYMDAY